MSSNEFLDKFLDDVSDWQDSGFMQPRDEFIDDWAEKLDELIADEVAKEVELDKEL